MSLTNQKTRIRMSMRPNIIFKADVELINNMREVFVVVQC